MLKRSSAVSARRSGRHRIIAVLVILVVTALTPCFVGNAWAEEPAASTTSSTRKLAAQLLDMSNAERAAAGLGILKTNPFARSISEGHSDAMAAAKDIWHNDAYFAKGRKAMGAKFLGENVATAGTIERAHLALMKSPGHRANILRAKFNYVGFTVSIDDAGFLYATQNFAFIPEAPVAAAPVAAAPVAEAPAPDRVLSGTTASRKPAKLEHTAIEPAAQKTTWVLLATTYGLFLVGMLAGLKRLFQQICSESDAAPVSLP